MSRRLAAPLLVLVLVLGAASAALSQHAPAAKSVTLTGTLIDTKCYSMNTYNKGQDHKTPAGDVKSCARACASMGLPVGLLTGNGQVYVLVAPVPAFTDHMAETARVTGTKVYGGSSIRPDKVEVRGADGKWTALNITTMM